MFISQILLQNFKVYQGKTVFKPSEHLTFLAGQNNAGKSTIFEALSILRDGKSSLDELRNKQAPSTATVKIEVEFSGNDIDKLIDKFATSKKQEVLKKHIYHGEQETIKLSRTSQTREWKTAKGEKKIIKSGDLAIKNPETEEYENPTGIDAPIKSLFSVIWVKADQSADSEINFKNSGLIGSLVGNLAASFKNYGALEKAHKEVFEQLDKKLAPNLSEKLDDILDTQYGHNIKTRIDFVLPDVKSFLTNANLLVDDGVETDYSQKGHGLQRSIALALIQLQSELQQEENKGDMEKPVFYFIDEPEVYLHPQGQRTLRDSLVNLSETSQVFIATHSPYIIDKYNNNKQEIWVLKKTHSSENSIKIKNISKKLNHIGLTPTSAEITYFAYEIPTFEFHDQLYDQLTTLKNTNSVKSLDNLLMNCGHDVPLSPSSYNETTYCTLPIKIRNWYHHQSSNSSTFTDEELQSSTEALIKEIECCN